MIVAMGYLTYMGAAAGSPNSIDMIVAAELREGQARRRPVRLPGLPQDRRERQRRPRSAPDATSATSCEPGAIRRTLENPTAPMPSFRGPARGQEDRARRLPLLRSRATRAERGRAADGGPFRHAARRFGAGDVRPHRRRLRRHEHGHDGGAAPPLARARGRPGPRRARHARAGRGDGDGRPGDRARLARRRRRRLGLLRGHARAGAREGAGLHAGSRPTRWRCPYADDAFDAATVGFGARNFGDLPRGLREMVRVVQPGRARGDPRDHDAAEAAAVDVLLALVRSHRAAARAASTRRTRTCRARSSASRGRPRSPASLVAAGCRDVGWILTAGGIIAMHHGTVELMASAEAVAAVVEAGGAHVPGLMRDLEDAAGRARAVARARRSASTRARRSPPAASGCGRCWCSSPPGRTRPGATRRCARRSRSSSCTRRRWSTTTCSTPPCCGAGGRRSSPSRGPVDRHGDRRPAVLARVRRARGRRVGRAGAGALGRLVRAGPGRAAAARGRVEPRRRRASATCGAAISRPRGCSARRASWARWPAAATSRCWASSASGSGSRSSCSTTCSTSRGPAERTGKHRGTDLLDGTVTLPLILARERDPELGRARPARGADAGAGRGRVRRDRRDGRAGGRARGGAGDGRRREGRSAVPAGAVQQAALELVADGWPCVRHPARYAVRPRSLRAGSRWRPARRRSARPRPPCSPARGGAGP